MTDHPPLLEWGVAARAKAGQTESGDLCSARDFPEGFLVVVTDGIGHGHEACAASAAVATVVDALPAPVSLPSLVERCHDAAKRTRGVVLAAAWLPRARRELEWIGIGNVEGVLRQANGKRERLLTLSGIVGGRAPHASSRALPIAAGDVLVLATDGVGGAVLDEQVPGGPAAGGSDPGQLAAQLLSRHAGGTDDALVFVGVYRGTDAA